MSRQQLDQPSESGAIHLSVARDARLVVLKAATTPAAIGATNPVSVFPLTMLKSPMKSGEPTMAPICQPVPLPISLRP